MIWWELISCQTVESKGNLQLRDSSVLPPKMDTETAIEDLYDTMEYEEEDTYDSMGD